MAKKNFMLGNRDSASRNKIQNNLVQRMEIEEYQTKVDYQMLQVTEEDKQQLINLEQIVVKKQEIISTSLMDISMALYDAQKILSRKKGGDGTFSKWFTQLGLSKPFVYRCLDKYKLYLISNMETVMDLTTRETTMITKALNNKELSEADKKAKLKQTIQDRKNLELTLKDKKEELEILKEEIKLQKQQIAIIKELEKSMKQELKSSL